MEKADLVFQNTPVSKEVQARMIELTTKVEFKLVILDQLLGILTKETKNLEEAAMLFHEAKPLAKMLKERLTK